MVYPKEFKERVKACVPLSIDDRVKLLNALNAGSPIVGCYLSERSSMLFKQILDAKTLDEVAIISREENKVHSLFMNWVYLFGKQCAT